MVYTEINGERKRHTPGEDASHAGRRLQVMRDNNDNNGMAEVGFREKNNGERTSHTPGDSRRETAAVNARQ